MLVPNYAQAYNKTAKEEYVSRELARRSLVDFTCFTYPRYMVDPFHDKISQVFHEAMEGGRNRILIFAPPQHGKSELVSVRLPAFWIGNKPEKPVIICSYGALLAQSKSTQAKRIIASRKFQQVFPDLFKTEEALENPREFIKYLQSMITSAGVGGPITGFGAGLGIIDDPIKNYEQALSESFREKTWEWYQTTFRTRIWENGVIAIIMTRWHEDDLAGRLLNDQGARWQVYRFPALSETQEERDLINHKLGMPDGIPDIAGRIPGMPLAPHRFSKRTLLETQEEIGARTWSSEYQGFPQAPGGNMFKEAWFKIIEFIPQKVSKRVRYWDKASTEGGGARSAGVLMSFDGVYWTVEDVVKGQWSTWQREQVMKEVAEQDDEQFGQVEIWLETEGGSVGKDSSLMSIRNLAGHVVKTEHPSRSKEIRASPMATQAEAGHVRMVKAAWNKAFIAEITMFPNSTYKDQVDGASGAFNKLIRHGWARGAGA